MDHTQICKVTKSRRDPWISRQTIKKTQVPATGKVGVHIRWDYWFIYLSIYYVPIMGVIVLSTGLATHVAVESNCMTLHRRLDQMQRILVNEVRPEFLSGPGCSCESNGHSACFEQTYAGYIKVGLALLKNASSKVQPVYRVGHFNVINRWQWWKIMVITVCFILWCSVKY